MFRKVSLMFAFVAMAFSLIASPAMAAVTFDAATGTGFVGKGDVQTALDLNNQQLQTATLTFAVFTTTENTWLCLNNGGNQVTKNNTTTTEGVVSGPARVKNQITGYNLTGYSGNPVTTTDGQATGTCPPGQSFVDGSLQPGTPTSVLTVNGEELTITPSS